MGWHRENGAGLFSNVKAQLAHAGCKCAEVAGFRSCATKQVHQILCPWSSKQVHQILIRVEKVSEEAPTPQYVLYEHI